MLEVEVVQKLNPWWLDDRHVPPEAELPRRDLFSTLWSALFESAQHSRAQVLLGPKQVGKSTLAKQVIAGVLAAHRDSVRAGSGSRSWTPQEILYVDFSNSEFARAPSIVEALKAANLRSGPEKKRLLVLDEVSQAPDWARGIKTLVDDSRSRRTSDTILATDSSASLLRQGEAEFLQGRADTHEITGLLFHEYLRLVKRPHESEASLRARRPWLHAYLAVGGVPEFRNADDIASARTRMRSDWDRALFRDLGREKTVDAERARTLFVYLARASGAEFSAKALADDLSSNADGVRGTDPRSVLSWVRLLERACLIARLDPAFAPGVPVGAAKQLRAQPKLYAADHGMIAAYDPAVDPTTRAGHYAKVYETVVLTHLRALLHKRRDFDLGYLKVTWRKDKRSFQRSSFKEGEIDFVLAFADRRIGIEVTSVEADRDKIEGTAWLARQEGLDRTLVVHGGASGTHTSGIELVNLEDFLLAPERFLGASA